LHWDGIDLQGRKAASGIYLIELKSSAGIIRKKLVKL